MTNRNSNDMQDDAIINDTSNDGTANNDDSNVQPPAPVANPEFAGMSDRERALVTKAREEEKRKLYKKQREQDELITSLQAQVRALQQAPPPPTPAGQQSRDEKLDTLIASINKLSAAHDQTNARIESMQNEEAARRRRVDLDRHAADKIREIRVTGDDVIEALVGGDTEEDIDISVRIAHAEWMLAVQKEREKAGRRNPAPSSVTVQQSGGRPAGVPSVQTPNSVEAVDHANINDLTSQEAVRSGDYEKNRSNLFSKLKRSYRYGGTQPSA